MTELSKRLEDVIALAGGGECVADIGCDHGYLSIELVRRGLFKRAVAMDLRKGPLKAAEENIKEAGLEERIECRLSDGLEALEEGVADTAVCAGMGGMLIIDIMKASLLKFKSLKKFVLAPQSDMSAVRRYLKQEGFHIKDEGLSEDAGKYYQMLLVSADDAPDEYAEYAGTESLLDAAYSYGPVLLKKGGDLFKEYIARQRGLSLEKYESVKKALEADPGNPRLKERFSEICKELETEDKVSEYADKREVR